MTGETVIGGASVTPAVVTAHFHSINSEDFDRLDTLWTEDARLRAVGLKPRAGREQVMEYFRPLFGTWVEHQDTHTRAIVAGDVVTVEVSFTGTTTSGRTLSFDAVDVFDLSLDHICALSTWYDLHWLAKQL